MPLGTLISGVLHPAAVGITWETVTDAESPHICGIRIWTLMRMLCDLNACWTLRSTINFCSVGWPWDSALPASSQVNALAASPWTTLGLARCYTFYHEKIISYLDLLSSCDKNTYPVDRPGLTGQLLSTKQMCLMVHLFPCTSFLYSFEFWDEITFLLQFLSFSFVNHFLLFRIKTKQQFLSSLISPVRFEIDNKLGPWATSVWRF